SEPSKCFAANSSNTSTLTWGSGRLRLPSTPATQAVSVLPPFGPSDLFGIWDLEFNDCSLLPRHLCNFTSAGAKRKSIPPATTVSLQAGPFHLRNGLFDSLGRAT